MLIKGRTAFVYDVEVFPNYFGVTIKNTESGKHRCLEIYWNGNDMPDIAKIFLNKNIYFVSYNGIHYDRPLISYILLNYKELIKKPVWEINFAIKQMSDLIVTSENSNSWKQYKYANLYDDLDLLAMRWSQKLRVSLKALQVTMEYKNVEEYDGDFNENLPKEDLEKVRVYNLNDVESTEELLNRSIKDIDLRLAIEEQYNISALNKDGVNLGMEIIKKYYLDATGKNWNDIKDLRSPMDVIPLKDVIFNYIEFKTPTLRNLLKQLKETSVSSVNINSDNPPDKFEIKFEIGGVEHTYGIGGIHSVNKPEIFLQSTDYQWVDSDVTSLYPSIILQNDLYPKHLGKIFLEVYRTIYNQRVKAKKEGKKVENETLKLALNGLTGNLQSPYSWVYDPMMVFKIRINGQLMLLMLIEMITEAGFRLIQSNTDGIFVGVQKNRKKEYLNICREWEQKTRLNLEHDEFERFYQYAINDYIGVKKGWSESHDPKLIKKKGLFIDEPILGKGLAPLIIPEAINKYFVEGISPEETILNCKDIKKFCTFQKVAKDFNLEWGGIPVRHINRYYMSTNGKPLIKFKLEDGVKIRPTLLCADSGVTLYNKFNDIPIKERKINYQYYIKEAYKIINALEIKQLSLF